MPIGHFHSSVAIAGIDLIHQRVMCLTGWLLDRLTALLDGQPVPPLGEGWQDHYDHYARTGAMGDPQSTKGK